MATRIEIVPMGSIEPYVIEHLQEAITARFDGIICVASEHSVPVETYDSLRHQYDSQAILMDIKKLLNTGAIDGYARCYGETGSVSGVTREEGRKILAVMNQDIFADGLNYVFGQAILNGGCSLISLSRLRVDTENAMDFDNVFLKRIEKEAVHELGHVFGLRHCPNPACVMYLSGSIRDTDEKGSELCNRCSLLPAAASFRRMS